MNIPNIGSLWIHKEKDSIYRVLLITNEKTERPEEFPVTVCYQDVNTKAIWSRPLEQWLERVEPEDSNVELGFKAKW